MKTLLDFEKEVTPSSLAAGAHELLKAASTDAKVVLIYAAMMFEKQQHPQPPDAG